MWATYVSLKVFQHFILAIILSKRIMSLLLEYPSHIYFRLADSVITSSRKDQLGNTKLGSPSS